MVKLFFIHTTPSDGSFDATGRGHSHFCVPNTLSQFRLRPTSN